MPKLKRILCPVDFSEFSEWAYRHALSLSQRYGAKLYVQNVVELWRHPSLSFGTAEGYESYRSYLHAESRQTLHEFVMRTPYLERRPNCVVREGFAPDSILAFSASEQVDLIVMGTHGRRGFDRLMIGSVTERVLRNSLCPVLVVHGPPHGLQVSSEEPCAINFGSILFCTDFSENSQQALDYAILLAMKYNSELILAHVLENTTKPNGLAESMASATEQLAALVSPVQREQLSLRTIVRVGKPYMQILALCAETGSNLVVMAIRGASSLDLSVFGSTTHRVIQLGSCPVLAVHV